MYPTLREEAPSGERWVHEIKFDGHRAQAHLRNGQPTVYTRRPYDWKRRFQTIADALRALPKDLTRHRIYAHDKPVLTWSFKQGRPVYSYCRPA